MSDGHDREAGEVVVVERQPRAGGQVVVPLASQNCAQVWGALSLAQGAFEAPKRTKEATVEGESKAGRLYSYKYKYAPLEEIERVIRAPLAKNGLCRQQYLVSRGNEWFIRTMIGHSSGEWIATDYPVFASKPGAQGFASGVTYARRYGLSLALGLCPEDDDDAQIADSIAGLEDTVAHAEGDRSAAHVSAPSRTRRAKAEIDAFLAVAAEEAKKGSDSFRAWFKTLTPNNRALLRPGMAELQKAAEEGDARHPHADPLERSEGGSTSTVGVTRSLPEDYDTGEVASSGDGAEGGGAADAGEAPPRDPFWSQERLFEALIMSGDRPDFEMTRLNLLDRIAQVRDSAELMRFAAESKPTIDCVRLAFKSSEVQTAIAARLAELPA